MLFGDGAAAVVVQASDKAEGVIAEKLGCYADARAILRVRGMGTIYGNAGVQLGDTTWDFDGQEIFKRAVHGMTKASQNALERAGDLDRSDRPRGAAPGESAHHRVGGETLRHLDGPRVRDRAEYGNMSSATVPVALVEALEEGRVKPGSLLLTPAFGGGLTWCSHVIRWGDRVTPLGTTDIDLPPCTQTAVEIVKDIIARKSTSGAALQKISLPVGCDR